MQVGKRTVFMVLGYVDKDPDGVVEVCYSAPGEVVRLRDGRLAGAARWGRDAESRGILERSDQ